MRGERCYPLPEPRTPFALAGAFDLKFQLFDADLRLKRGIRRGAVAAVFVAAFLVVEQLVQNYFSSHVALDLRSGQNCWF